MNNKFIEIAERNMFIHEHMSVGERNDAMRNYCSFAELIVEECMITILKESKWYWDKEEFESADAVMNAARRVKEHFGVKV